MFAFYINLTTTLKTKVNLLCYICRLKSKKTDNRKLKKNNQLSVICL